MISGIWSPGMVRKVGIWGALWGNLAWSRHGDDNHEARASIGRLVSHPHCILLLGFIRRHLGSEGIKKIDETKLGE
jgi:hypothetical protein